MKLKLTRGQAWGVMEVLIAVIIMGFSMAIVLYSINSISDTQCVASLKTQTISLENAMLDVALGSPPTQREVVYNFPTCGNKVVEALRFSRFTEPSLCSICPGQYGTCWIIQPIVYDYSSSAYYNLVSADVCVDMPADIDLQTVDPNSAGACKTDSIFGPGPSFSDSGCPNTLPDGTSIPNKLASTNCNSPSPSPSSSVGSAVDPGVLYVTFGLKPATPRTVVFELVAASTPSQAKIIDICAKQTT